MTKEGYLRLCGATAFALIVDAREEAMSQREHLKGRKDGRAIPDTMAELLWVMTGDRRKLEGKALETFQSNARKYRLGKISDGAHVDLKKSSATVKAFDKKIKDNYYEALLRMGEFVDKFLEVGTGREKDKRLVRAFLDLISQDGEIKGEHEFYVQPDGRPLKRDQVLQMKKVCFPSFVLGIWHYSLVYPNDNQEAADSIDKICPAGSLNYRPYQGTLGDDWPIDIELFGLDDIAPVGGDDNAHKDKELYEADDEDANEKAEEIYSEGDEFQETPFIEVEDRHNTKQENTQVIYQMTQIGNNNTQIGSTASITINNTSNIKLPRCQLDVKSTGEKVLLPEACFMIGREQRKCNLVLNDTFVSALHLMIYPKNGKWILRDMGAANGTFIGGVKIQANMEYEIEDKDEIQIGNEILTVRIG